MNVARLTRRENGMIYPASRTRSFEVDAIMKLADYEDTGLTPERCSELARADGEGRLVVLPCKVGDTVYKVDIQRGVVDK